MTDPNGQRVSDLPRRAMLETCGSAGEGRTFPVIGSSKGLSAAVITKLTEQWKAEQRAFAERDLSGVDYVYLWADGIHVNIRLAEHKLCLPVMIGVRADGRKELVALADGYRESTESWADLLRDCRRRGMVAPVLAVGDGALGFWGALREVFPATSRRSRSPHIRGRRGRWPRSGTPRTVGAPWMRSRRSTPLMRRSSPRQSRRSPTMSTSCWRSATTRPNTGFTCAPPTRSSPLSLVALVRAGARFERGILVERSDQQVA